MKSRTRTAQYVVKYLHVVNPHCASIDQKYTLHSPIPDEVIGCGHQVVVHIEASQVINSLRGGDLLVGGLVVVVRTNLQYMNDTNPSQHALSNTYMHVKTQKLYTHEYT